MIRKNITFIITFIACTILCSCGNTSKNSTQFETPESPKKVLNDFIDATETKPETVSDLIDGFSFDMSEKQYQVHLSKLKKLKGDHVNLDIDGVSYFAYFSKPSFFDNKIYELNVQLFYKGSIQNHVTKEDFNSIAAYFKSVYGSDSLNYMYTEKPISDYPTHHWRKGNLYFKLYMVLIGDDLNSIALEYRNGPAYHSVVKGIQKRDQERRDKREKEIMAAGAVNVSNSSYDASVSQVIDYLKKNLKDPKSYEGIEWSKVKEETDGYSVYHKYRAKNSFGGYVIEAQIFYLDFGGNVIKVQNVE